MKNFWIATLISATLFALVLFLMPRAAPVAAQRGEVRGPFRAPPVNPVSFDGDVRRLPRAPIAPREIPRARQAARALAPQIALRDPVRQSAPAISKWMTQPLVSFKGLDFPTWGMGWPPDTNGDVGPNHYIQAVNISLGIFSKTGASLALFTYDSFFAGAPGPCGVGNNNGDPIVLYDPIADRWIVTNFSWLDFYNGPYYECIAVSKTGDLVAGGWWLYSFLADTTYLHDYPKLGVWADGIYMSANMFDLPGDIPQGVKLWAFNRAELINGLPLNAIYFSIAPGYHTILPANLRGALPPPGTPEFLATITAPNNLHLWKFHTDWITPSNSTLTGPTTLTTANFVMPCNAAFTIGCVPQLGGESVDGLGDRLMMQLQYRNRGGVESLWANHTVAENSAVGYPTGIRWYEIREPNGAPTIYQQGTFQPDSNYRWMGSLAVDRFGNLALGYSVSSASMYPAIRYTGRTVNDPLGVLTQGEWSLIEGTGSQSGGFARWGDYSAMTVDPVDDCTFWYTNQYFEATGRNWQTRIGAFQFGNCDRRLILFPILKDYP
jgi:hypothetical protein